MKLPGLGSWRRPQEELDENSRAAALEWIVDLHTFEPADLERMATNAGAVEVRTASEEFTAAMLGWPVRTFESTVPPGQAGLGLGEVRLQQLDHAELGRRQRVAARRAEGLVLQRHGHRGQAVLTFAPSTTSPTCAASEGGAALAEVAGYRADRRQPGRRHRLGRERVSASGPPCWSRRRCCAARRRSSSPTPVGLAVHRRGAAAGHRGRGGRASGRAAGRRARCTT